MNNDAHLIWRPVLGYCRRILKFFTVTTHERRGVFNHRQLDCLFNSLFRLVLKKVWKFHTHNAPGTRKVCSYHGIVMYSYLGTELMSTSAQQAAEVADSPWMSGEGTVTTGHLGWKGNINTVSEHCADAVPHEVPYHPHKKSFPWESGTVAISDIPSNLIFKHETTLEFVIVST